MELGTKCQHTALRRAAHPDFGVFSTLLVPFALAEPLVEFTLSVECGGAELPARDPCLQGGHCCQSCTHTFAEQKNSIWRGEKKPSVRDETEICV